MDGLPPTPMLDKMEAVRARSQEIGEFLEWLGQQGYVICCSGRYPPAPAGKSTEQLLAEYFGIDLEAAERERRAVLDFVREQRT